MLNIDFSEATCIFIYLVPEGMKLLQPLLVDALRRGVRIVTYGKIVRVCYYSNIPMVLWLLSPYAKLADKLDVNDLDDLFVLYFLLLNSLLHTGADAKRG